MNTTLKTILIIVGALIVGGALNMGIIIFGHALVPAPEGVNPQDVESIKANAHLYTAQHFFVPFLAHALGTLTGAFLAAKFTPNNQKRNALIVGAIFLLGGISMAFSIPGFWMFSIVDLLFAYIPMALLGWSLAGKPQ